MGVVTFDSTCCFGGKQQVGSGWVCSHLKGLDFVVNAGGLHFDKIFGLPEKLALAMCMKQ